MKWQEMHREVISSIEQPRVKLTHAKAFMSEIGQCMRTLFDEETFDSWIYDSRRDVFWGT